MRGFVNGQGEEKQGVADRDQRDVQLGKIHAFTGSSSPGTESTERS